MSKPPFVRPAITKFFEEGMLENYSNGSFWFGTLKRYRMIEREPSAEVAPRFLDRREGIVEHAYHLETGHAKDVKIGGMSIADSFVGGNFGADILVTHEFNDFVFCASWGAYSRQQHLDIKDGAMSAAGTLYKGNPKLTHYAEIDLIEFLHAVSSEAPKSQLWNTKLPVREYLFKGPVSYGQTQKSIYIPSVYQSSGTDLTAEDYLRTVFIKPKNFSPENEFRVVLRSNAPNFLQGDPEGMKLKHKKLRRSIRKIGTLDGGV